jgi:hypothetical protein
MPQRFGQASDYSQTFAYLAQQADLQQEAAARRLDAKREADLASRDSLMSTRYAEGKISGDEWLAYIRRRISETSYDKAQQNRWREAYAQYSTAIADDKAEAAYAENQNIHLLLAHYRERLNNTKKGTPEYTALAQRVRQIRDKRDEENLRAQARKIERQAAKGNKSTKDLLAYYRATLKSLPKNSTLRAGIEDKISELSEQWRNERFNIQMQKIESAIATGLNPQDAANQMQQVLDKFGIRNRSPEAYWQWQEKIRATRAVPDPVEVAKVENAFINGKISAEEYRMKVDEWAAQIAPYDQTAAWEMLTAADKVMMDAAEETLPNPEAMGLPSGGSSNPYWNGTVDVVQRAIGDIAHITQMDGSKYSNYNCTMAAGAMLAHSMGTEGLTGGDLRHLSGVTSEGTNLSQLASALNAAGVTGTKLYYDREVGFEQFKKRLRNGATAVLSGWNGDIPSQFNSSGINAGHAMFVAGYDPQKGFLMLDPAKSNDKGTWWPEWVVRDFGWTGMRHGDALFSPPNTVDPKTLSRKGVVKHVSVDARPKRPDTPASYHGQFDPGPDKENQLVKAEQRRLAKQDTKLQRRLKAAGIEPSENLDSVSEVKKALEERMKTYTNILETIDKFNEEWDGTSASVNVTVGGVTQSLSPEDIQALSKNLIYLVDGQRVFYEALDDSEGLARTRQMRGEVLQTATAMNAVERDFAENAVNADLNRVLQAYEKSNSPEERRKLLEEAQDIIVDLADIREEEESGAEGRDEGDMDPGSPEQETTEAEQDVASLPGLESPEEQQENAALIQVLMALQNPELTPEQREAAVVQIVEQYDIDTPNGWPGGKVNENSGSLLGRNIAAATTLTNREWLLNPANGWQDPATGGFIPRGTYILSNGGLQVVKTKVEAYQDPESGVTMHYPLIDMSQFDAATQKGLAESGIDDAANLPNAFVRMNGEDTPIKVIPDRVNYGNIMFLKVASQAGYKEYAGKKKNVGEFLTEDEIAELVDGDDNRIRQLIENGTLESSPWVVDVMSVPNLDGTSTVHYRDPDTQKWWEGALPVVDENNRISGVDSPYRGAEVNKYGFPQPELVWDPDKPGMKPAVSVPKSKDVSHGSAQRLIQQNPGMDSGMDREPTSGEIVTYDATSERITAQYTPEFYSVVADKYAQETLRNITNAQAQDPTLAEQEREVLGEIIDDKVVSLRDRALANGLPDPMGAQPEAVETEQPDDFSSRMQSAIDGLADFGITVGETPKPEDKKAYDPTIKPADKVTETVKQNTAPKDVGLKVDPLTTKPSKSSYKPPTSSLAPKSPKSSYSPKETPTAPKKKPMYHDGNELL